MPRRGRFTPYRRIVTVDEFRKVITIYRPHGNRKYEYNKRRDNRLLIECQRLWFEGRGIPDFTRTWTYGIDPVQ